MRILLVALTLCINVSTAFAGSSESISSYFRVKSVYDLKLSNITQQTLDYSCGAAALNILFHNYFGDTKFHEPVLLKDIVLRLDAEEIADRIKDGFTMLDLKRFAERLGYSAVGAKIPYDSIYMLKGPVIILLHKNGIKHFVVLKGAKQGKSYISDPISGNYRLSEYELKAQWRGEALIIGRDGFGTPTKHLLSISNETPNIEATTTRNLQHLNIMRTSGK